MDKTSRWVQLSAVSGKAMCDNTMIYNTQARVLQSIPATVASLQNTCFLSTWTSRLKQLYHDTTTPVHLQRLGHLDNYIFT